MSLTILYMRFWPDRHGGVEEHLWRLASHARRHTPVQVLTENRMDIAPIESPLDNLTIYRDRPVNMGKLWRWPDLPRVAWWIKQLKKHPPKGWIWAIEPTAAIAAITLGYAHRTVFNPPCCGHAMHRVWRARRHVTSMKIPRISRTLEHIAYQKAAKVIVASHALGKQFALAYGWREQVHVVPRGADIQSVESPASPHQARQAMGLAPDAFVIGFVGRLDPCKDIPHLLAACAKPGLLALQDRILIVGTGPEEKRIRKIARTLGLEKRLMMTGALHDQQLRQAYAAMNTLVLPSVYEGYGMVILEAMAAGIPVIGRPGDWQTSFTSMGEMIQPGVTGQLMHPIHNDDLTAHLQWMKEHPQQTRAMGQRGRQQLAQRPWEQVIFDYLQHLSLTSSPLRTYPTPTQQAA